MRYITLSGVDGSGKSTQLAFLKEHLERNDKKVSVFNAVEFSSANRIARFFKGEQKFEPGKDRAVTKASWCSIVLREKFLVLDFLRFRFLLRKLRREGFDYLLSDRSFYDSLINIEYLRSVNSRQSTINTRRDLLLSVLCYLLPVSDVALYFDIDPETIMQRERVPEQGIGYLRTKTALFKEKISDWNLVPIDAESDRESVFQEILKRI
jgi:thymidylate kinase